MHPEKIKFKLAIKKLSQKKIADAADVSPTSVHKVIYGKMHSQKIANSLAQILQIQVLELFPDSGYEESNKKEAA